MNKNEQIRLFRPAIGQEEIDAVSEVLRSGWIGLGPKTAEFEKALATYIGCSETVGLNSCTAALDMALRLIGVNYGDEVIVPTNTFVSTAHAIVYNHGTPIFADINSKTLNIDIYDAASRITSRTKAVILVHYGGRMVDVNEVYDVFMDKGVVPYFIEDCAHAMGSYLKKESKIFSPWGKAPGIWRAGTLGNIGCFSFHAVKNLAMGDGGALCFNLQNDEKAKRAKRLRWLGIDKGTWDRSDYDKSYWWEYHCDEIGYKNHMNDIAAAIGLEQLKKLDGHNARRKEIAELYTKELSEYCVTPEMDTESSQSSWHIYHIKVPSEYRDKLASHLTEQKIDTGVHYKPIHLYKCYGNTPSLPVAEKTWREILSLPMHPGLSDDDVGRVIEEVKNFFRY